MQRTAQLRVWSPTLAVTVARPGATAVMVPSAVTVAILVSLLVQLTSPDAPVTVIYWVSPSLSRVMSLALRVGFVSAGASAPLAAGSVPAGS